ncbi:hypothetical protein EHI8A_117510 [Entamoeba histolytica HM-1:IMSS-B]|uniref:FHA domain-containing protein n=6 Tax=Entamoeba histolytica TaxID=5759 RepID=C4M874_ENTH1|nr:hypothetical protein EHI_098770 [Entamoeba histolytica HM-1:IMSS]EMD43802.1 Hypothetical protein EHI5A_148260 [Entamoeba histolytica KU27]EMH75799.1 hypothetical protein EHI8A_117510 [Entamoeba histolytica HM-1:IMSS-B]EMS16171.1 hypothetical protein KM1_186200 [Entamoeba histolytica HM-3:IMSS]ENY64957.1 hypothetical protein EHI7A_109010 [Entamoeba histolytica HM-1:IMSS-A]GAT97775.1 hypothetical protein CL6EHI_098770 [Entamoeba histolytica]|eukprot:XP_652539.2 hypothetical protein EHI_098770 [Entamoeba histolytica HM-1:IMSS]
MVWTLYHPSLPKPLNLFCNEKYQIGRNRNAPDGFILIHLPHHSISGTHLHIEIKNYDPHLRMHPIRITDLSTYGTFFGGTERLEKSRHYTITERRFILKLASEPKEIELKYTNYDFYCLGIIPPQRVQTEILRFGMVVEQIEDCSHVVCKQIMELEETAIGLIFGKKFITQKWFSALQDIEHSFPDEKEFFPPNEYPENGEVPCNDERKHLFNQWSFIGGDENTTGLVRLCGGQSGINRQFVCYVEDGISTDDLSIDHYRITPDDLVKAIIYENLQIIQHTHIVIKNNQNEKSTLINIEDDSFTKEQDITCETFEEPKTTEISFQSRNVPIEVVDVDSNKTIFCEFGNKYSSTENEILNQIKKEETKPNSNSQISRQHLLKQRISNLPQQSFIEEIKEFTEITPDIPLATQIVHFKPKTIFKKQVMVRYLSDDIKFTFVSFK